MLRFEPLVLDEYSSQLYDHFVPENHPLRQMDEILDFSFLLPLVAHRYNHWIGRPAEHPERMWRMLFAEYYLSLSDEKVALAAHESMALRLFLKLGCDEKPPHPTTLQKFRFDRMKDDGLYLSIHFALLKQAEEKKLLNKEERQIFDTSHVRSNTRVVSIPYLLLQARWKVIREVKAIDEEYGQTLEEQDKADREAYREERKRRVETELPKPSKEEKANAAAEIVRKTLVKVREKVERGQIEATERLHFWLAVLEKVIKDRERGAEERIVSIHDLEARKGKKGFGQWDGRKLALNIQEESRLITACEMVSANVNDNEMVESLLDQQKESMAIVPKELTADKAADTGPIRASLLERGITAHIPIGKPNNSKGDGLFTTKDFECDAETHSVTCPAGKTTRARVRETAQKRDGYIYQFQKTWCRPCELRAKCCKGKMRFFGRRVYLNRHWELYAEAKRRNETVEFERAYGKRGRIEGKIWELVYHGVRRCRYQGNLRSRVQLLVTVAVVNAKRVVKLLGDGLGAGYEPEEQCALKAV